MRPARSPTWPPENQRTDTVRAGPTTGCPTCGCGACCTCCGKTPRLRSFAERELGPLLVYDAEHATTLVGDLAAFLEAGGNKALAASRAHLARPTFYQRLALIERVLGVSLADPESRASLHVALLAHQEGR